MPIAITGKAFTKLMLQKAEEFFMKSRDKKLDREQKRKGKEQANK